MFERISGVHLIRGVVRLLVDYLEEGRGWKIVGFFFLGVISLIQIDVE